METHKLPVYGASRMLYLQLHNSTRRAPVSLRRGKIADMEMAVANIMRDISFANNGDKERRCGFIDSALSKMEGLEIDVRIIFDLGCTSKKGFAAIIRREQNVVKQLLGWRKKTLENA